MILGFPENSDRLQSTKQCNFLYLQYNCDKCPQLACIINKISAVIINYKGSRYKQKLIFTKIL